MKKYSVLFFAISLLIISMAACKKYDNGPTFSIYSKTSRVDNNWKIGKIFLNGSEKTLSKADLAKSMELRKDGKATFRMDSYTDEFGVVVPSSEITGKWEFGDNKETIIFTEFTKKAYTITRLTNSEMWLTDKIGADIWEFQWETK